MECEIRSGGALILLERRVGHARARPPSERLWAMIAAVNFPHPLLSDMAIAPPGPDDDAHWESLTSFELVLRAKAGDDRARDLLIGRYQTRLQRWAHGRLPLSARGAPRNRTISCRTPCCRC